LEFYEDAELLEIVLRSTQLLGIRVETDGALEIARRSRGTPRVTNRLLRRVRDFAQVEGFDTITPSIAIKALERLDVDAMGLDAMDKAILLTIIDKFEGGPVGIETLSAVVSEQRDTLEEVYEPFLLQSGLLQRTPRGRVATAAAYRHLGLPQPPSRQQALFPDNP
jgi:Holliday junction DNA helicase RuvB